MEKKYLDHFLPPPLESWSWHVTYERTKGIRQCYIPFIGSETGHVKRTVPFQSNSIQPVVNTPFLTGTDLLVSRLFCTALLRLFLFFSVFSFFFLSFAFFTWASSSHLVGSCPSSGRTDVFF